MSRSDDPTSAGTGVRPRRLPLLPLRDIIVFPHMVVPLFVGREKSIAALEEAAAGDKHIILSAQRRAQTNDPTADEIFPVGTLGQVIQLLRLPDGTVKVLVEGKRRARVRRYLPSDRCFMVEAEEVVEPEERGPELEALVAATHQSFESYAKLNKRIPPDMLVSVQTIDEPSRLADTIAAHLSLKLADKQHLLETESATRRLERLFEHMRSEIDALLQEKKARARVKKQMERTQKEYYLNEQMQAIQKELGERDEFKSEIQELEEKIRAKVMPEEAQLRVKKELKKLKMMSPMSAEATVVRNYIDWVLALPWAHKSDARPDVDKAQKVLDADHYGLGKIKERVIEHLAVQALVGKLRGPILCLVGPPGVGKTSLARSVARATGRSFVRLSLGGVRDEAEIRGHRRTYIGALPGKIIQSLKKAGTSNPVMLLDEIDKMSSDFRGDPSAALLEVLDPEQNSTFNDHYLDLDVDLSDVMFITTANTLHAIPGPLQDRMEVVHLAGYTEWEKLAIAREYLIPKQREANGLAGADVEITDDAVRAIIHEYTREAGVRSLERELATVCRKLARKLVDAPATEAKKKPAAGKKKAASKKSEGKVTAKNLVQYLGEPKFRAARRETHDEIGLTQGLAVTAHGGDLLATEVTVVPGSGKLVLTGKLGDVMQESAQAAISYVRSRADALGLLRDFYQKVDIHVHFPEGAIPKDGPSAGVTMVTSLVSALLRVPVRRDVAMTGEITLRGKVLAIGGVKDKILAAHRADVFRVLIPAENLKDLKDVPERVLADMTIVGVEHVDEVLRAALALAQPAEFLPGPSITVDWRKHVVPGAAPDAEDSGRRSRATHPPTLNADGE